MYNNLPTDPEFRREICALKGIPYTDPEPPPAIAAPTRPEQTYTAAEIQALIEVAVNERMQLFEQRMIEHAGRSEGLSLLRTVEDLRWRVRDLENRLTKPLDPRGHLPDLVRSPSSTFSFSTTRSIRRSRSARSAAPSPTNC